MALPAATGSAGAHSKCLMLYCGCCDALPTPSPHLLPYKHIPPRLPPLQQQEVQLHEAPSASSSTVAAVCPPNLTLAPLNLDPPCSNKKCNCKKSKCLKLYCDCFAGGGFCGPQCSCAGCSNRPDNM